MENYNIKNKNVTKNLFNLIESNNNIFKQNSENEKINTKSISSEYEEDYIIKLEEIKPDYYPIFPNSLNGYTLYADIHKYLLSKADTNSKIQYPEYIKDYPDANIENEKRKFRNLCNNYSLNNYNELCF